MGTGSLAAARVQASLAHEKSRCAAVHRRTPPLATPSWPATLSKPMPRPRLTPAFVDAPGFDPALPHLSVDGMTAAGPNLSHWPGNRTPRRYKADLSTGICLLFARAPEDEQAAFLGDATFVVNDHYDTDGFLSMLAVTRPDVAFAHEELCLAAAATGDFQACGTMRGFAVDRIVAHLARADSPVADAFAGLQGPAKCAARYRWLLDHAERVLGDPESLAPLWENEWARVADELSACRAGALEREVHGALGFSVVRTTSPVSRIALNTLAGAYRVLHVERAAEGPRYRYHDRTETWFEVASFVPPARIDLRPVAAALQDMEGAADGPFRWCADAPTEPVPELWFGIDEPQAYGQVTRTLGPSRLAATVVAGRLAEAFGAAQRQ